MTTVVNKKSRQKFDVFIGRPSIFGNPFSVRKYGRAKCIAMYKEYFLNRIDTEPQFKQSVLELRDKRLGCFCKPLACHGDVIVEWLDTYYNLLPEE